MSNKERLSTSAIVSSGIPELDEIIGGGFHPGYVVLVAGHPGAGKTTMGATFLYYGALRGEAGIYVSFVEGRDEFYRHMRSIGMDFEKLEREGLFEFIEIPTIVSKDLLEDIIALLGRKVLELNARRVVIDSITSITDIVSKEEARAFLHTTLFKLMKPAGVVTYLIAELPIGSKTIGYGFEEFLADAVIKLVVEKVVGLLRRKMVLHKVREASLMYQEYEFTIGKGGIRLYTKAQRRIRGSYTLERINSGIEGLDKMLGGGFLKSSSTLVAGPSGTGKTLLLLTLALYNASQGRRVLYVSFEESEDQLRNAARTLGYDIDELESRDLLKVVALGPGIYTPEALYYTLSDLIEETLPNILIADGLTALARFYGPQEFTFLSRNIIMTCKTHGITSFFTLLSDVMAGELAGVSTITDTIIALWFDKEGNQIKRKVAVLKMRGSWHDRTVRSIDYVDGKVVVK